MGGYVVNPRKVVHQTIDGETIVIHFGTGNYYSLAGAGADIWQLLAHGWPAEAIAERLGQVYEAGGEELRPAVERLLEELAAEDLIEVGAASIPPGDPAAAGGPRRPYQPPVLERFTDMQDFLLVDPIHEVDDAGWPYTNNGG